KRKIDGGHPAAAELALGRVTVGEGRPEAGEKVGQGLIIEYDARRGQGTRCANCSVAAVETVAQRGPRYLLLRYGWLERPPVRPPLGAADARRADADRVSGAAHARRGGRGTRN